MHVSARAVNQGPDVANGKALGEASYKVTLVGPVSGRTQSAGQITIFVGTPPFGRATEVKVTGKDELMGSLREEADRAARTGYHCPNADIRTARRRSNSDRVRSSRFKSTPDHTSCTFGTGAGRGRN